MKCPICGGDLETAIMSLKVLGCPKCHIFGCAELYERFADVKNKLDIAGATLQEIDGCCEDNKYADNVYVGLDGHDTRNIALDVKKTLAEITAPEQKDNK